MAAGGIGFADGLLATLERGVKKFPSDAQHYQEYASFQVERAEAGDARAEMPVEFE